MLAEAPEPIDIVKDKLKRTWTAGDYGLIARGLEQSAKAFLDSVSIPEAARVLDVACGTGQLAIPAARSGAKVTGIDIAGNLIAQARERASNEGLAINFEIGDAEDMPYADAAFDVVISLIGAMFAPRPERAASELLRVCRPGGRVVMGNWTPEGLVGDSFRIIGKYVPPSGIPSPLLWGEESIVQERFGEGVSELRLTRCNLHFDYPITPSQVVSHYLDYFGPAKRAAEGLDAEDRNALRADLERLWSGNNTATDGTTQADAEILKVEAVRR